MEIFEAIRWRPGIGDPTPLGWLTVLAYLCVTIICTIYVVRLKQQTDLEQQRRQVTIWGLVALLLFLLGINKQLDLQTLLSQIGREIARTQGWYGDRRAVQFIFILLVTAVGGLSISALAYTLRRTLRQHWLTFLGLSVLLLFVVVRAISFHYVDLFLYTNIVGELKLSSALELGSLILIGTSLFTVLRQQQSDRSIKPQSVILISGVILIAMLGVATVLGFLSFLVPDQGASFEAVTPPYQHTTVLQTAKSTPHHFTETFTGDPAAPTPWRPSATWDVTIHSRDWLHVDQLAEMEAIYGTDCANPAESHTVSQFEDMVFQCNGRIITAIHGEEYAAISLTPNQLVDFSAGPAEITFDLSTVRLSGRDWVELWITPYHGHLQLPALDWVADLNGMPEEAIYIQLSIGGENRFIVSQINNYEATELTQGYFEYNEYLDSGSDIMGRYSLRIDLNQIRFGLPEADAWWSETIFAQPLDWHMGVVQFSHHSFVPTQDCTDCQPNSWQWDNIDINPARPFTMIPANQRIINRGTGGELQFPQSAPSQAYLRFMALAETVQLSFDGGETWQLAQKAPYTREQNGFRPYWTPVPAGITTVYIRALDDNGRDWLVRDPSIWSLATE